MKIKKLPAKANQRNLHSKRLLCLLRKDILFLRLVKMEKLWKKIQTKAILKNIDQYNLYLNPARQKDYYNIVETKPKRVLLILVLKTGTISTFRTEYKSRVCTLVLFTNRY
jgi:hypothetical protein